MATLPYRPTRVAEEAVQFFERMEQMRGLLATKLNTLQQKRVAAANAKRREPPPLHPGSKVWYRPEPQPGRDKLEPKWRGPGVVLRRVADHSYVVQVDGGREQEAHRSQLYPHVEDEFVGEPFPLYYFSGKAPVLELGPGEWEVEEVLDHKMQKNELTFLIKWKGWEEPSWEPYHHVSTGAIWEYCQAQGLVPNLVGTQ